MSGKVVLKKTAKANETFTINSSIPAGIYHVDVSSKNKKVMSTKLMIQ
jgi:ribosomal protein L31